MDDRWTGRSKASFLVLSWWFGWIREEYDLHNCRDHLEWPEALGLYTCFVVSVIDFIEVHSDLVSSFFFSEWATTTTRKSHTEFVFVVPILLADGGKDGQDLGKSEGKDWVKFGRDKTRMSESTECDLKMIIAWYAKSILDSKVQLEIRNASLRALNRHRKLQRDSRGVWLYVSLAAQTLGMSHIQLDIVPPR